MALAEVRGGAVILSASGMRGRPGQYHLANNLPRTECTVLITGFQAAGTLGRRFVDGARNVRIFGQPVPVRASIVTTGGLSAHADQAALLGWSAVSASAGADIRRSWRARGGRALATALRRDFGWRTWKFPPTAASGACRVYDMFRMSTAKGIAHG